MKIIQSLYLLPTLISICILSCNKSDTDTGDNILHDHPRILLFEEEESAIRELLQTDYSWQKISTHILDESDKILSKSPVERVLIGRRLLDKSSEALRRIFFLSYAWRMTSQSEYLERAEQELLAISDFTDWNPSHFLDVAEMTMAAAIGYDWLYHGLSSGSRSVIKKAIVEKGLRPSLNSSNNWWLKSSNNWNQVCNAGMTFGALAVYEDEKELADQLIERSVNSLRLPLEEYEPDGAYPEGYGYWGYGTGFHVMYISAMKKVFGDFYELNITEAFLKTAGYYENMTGPEGDPFNYSDCGTASSLNPAMFWFASELNDPSLLWSERYHLLNKSLPNNRLLPAVLIWSSGITIDQITPPMEQVWTGGGDNPVALLRTSWSDPDAIYACLKTGSPSVNHGHMDIGSFVLDAKGERWAMDFGMQNYNSLESAGIDLWNMKQTSTRWDVFRYNNFAHNTLTVNNEYQNVSGKASIISWSGSPGMLNAVTDMTMLYSGNLKKSVRGIAIVDDQYLMVRDEIETSGSSVLIRWNMVTSATVSITGSNTAELVINGKKLLLKVNEPSVISLRTWSTDSPNSWDAENPGTIMTGFETTAEANSSVSLVVLLMPEGSQENKEYSAKKITEWPASE